ncbi:hypothetical protein JXB02_00460 [Candidatus Woesearchaeota archaeon]|nr:hypothetical protein [Candidatus Woesearchaeota archaeon]
MAINEPKNLISLVLGLILLALGGIPLLNQFGVVGFNVPEFLLGLVGQVILYIIAAGGLYLIIEAFMEGMQEGIGKVTFIVGLVVLAIGLIPLLFSFGVVQFTIPFLTSTVFNVLFVIEGIFLVIAAFVIT